MQNHTWGEIRNSIVLFMLFMIVLPFLFSWCASNTTPQSNEWSVKSQAYQAYKDALFEKVWAWYPKYFLDKRYDTAFIWFSNSEASKKIINDFILKIF